MKFDQIRYAGHSAVFLENKDFVAAIDPWLEGNPRCPDKLKNPERLDLIVLTHGHSDHASDVLRLAKKYTSTIVATYELAVILNKQGVPEKQLLFMNKGGTTTFSGVKITLTHAMHSSSFDSNDGTVYAGEPCGVVLRTDSQSIYHAGDTALFSDMSLIGEFYRPEVALLPIGDCFTMGPTEAARAAKLVGCKVAIPIHFATFGLLTGTADEFTKACRETDVEVIALEPGEVHQL